MKSLLIVTFVILNFAGTSFAKEPFSKLDFEQACELAKKENKLVLIDFFTTWCGPCKRLDQTTWQDTKVVQFLTDQVIALKIDAEAQKDLAKRFKVTAYPTIVFIKSDGNELDRITGYRDAQPFLAEANALLKGTDSLTYVKELATQEKNQYNLELRLQYANVLAQKDHYQESVDQYWWCYNYSLQYNSTLIPYCLGSILQLSQSYPEAKQALIDRRNELENSVLTGQATPIQLKDFASLNICLGEAEKNLDLYEHNKTNKELRAEILDYVIDNLLEAKRYGEIVADLPDPLAKIDRNLTLLNQELEKSQQLFRMDDKKYAEAKKVIADATVNDCHGYYQALLATNRIELANRVAEHFISISNAGATYEILINSAYGVGDKDIAKALYEQARKTLPEQERALLHTPFDRSIRLQRILIKQFLCWRNYFHLISR